MIKIYIAKSLAIYNCIQINVTNILIESETVSTDGALSINFYHLGVAMNFTCTIHKEMDGIVTYSHNF
jgi:hypothetical protein